MIPTKKRESTKDRTTARMPKTQAQSKVLLVLLANHRNQHQPHQRCSPPCPRPKTTK